jgi:hypothetical protein
LSAVAQVTAEQVAAAEEALNAAKTAKGDATSGPEVEAYMAAAQDLTDVRVAFRRQEENAGRRVGFVAGDAEQTGGNQ